MNTVTSETLPPPCADCLRADINSDRRPMMCRRVAVIAIANLEKYWGLDILEDKRSEAEIALAYTGYNALVDAAVIEACKSLQEIVPAGQTSILDTIQR